MTRPEEVIAKCYITPIDKPGLTGWLIRYAKGERSYVVNRNLDYCTCKSYEYCPQKPKTCKHILALRILRERRDRNGN